MARTLQFRRGTTAELSAITGAEGELFVDLDKNAIVVMDGSTQGGVLLATESYVTTEVSNLVNSAPATLDTLNELAAALGDDPNFATTVSNQIGDKADKTTTISAGSGLTGGGDLSAGRTISHADTSSQSSVNGSGNTFIQDVTLDTYGHVTGLNTASVTIPDTANDATITLSAGNALTGGGNFTTDQSTNETITFAVASNAIGANELNVSGDGGNGQVLSSDGDGTFTWIDVGGGGGLDAAGLNSLDPIEVGDGNDASSFSSAVGLSNTASGSVSSAFGKENASSGVYSSAFGFENIASAFSSSAFGYKNNASASSSSAFGYQNNASGDNSSAMGWGVNVSTNKVQEFGKWLNDSNRGGAIRIHETGLAALTIENTATAYTASVASDGAEADGSLADGMFAFRRDGTDVYLDGNFGGTIETKAIGGGGGGLDAAGLNSINPIEVGDGNDASGTFSSAVGYSNTASGNYSSALGIANSAGTFGSTAVGFNNSASGSAASAFGYQNFATGTSSSAFGFENTASGDDATAVGRNNEASGGRSSAFGYGNTASAFYSSAIGYENTAAGSTSSAFGRDNTVNGSFSSAIGYNNTTSSENSSAFGVGNTATEDNTLAVGLFNTANGNNSSAFGSRVEVATNGVQEFGKWGSSNRESAIRLHDTGMAALTIENNATAYSASAAANGAEANGELADGMFAFRRDGDDIYIDINIGGTAKSALLATVS